MDQIRLKKHPRFNILVSECGTVIKNMETDHIYKLHTTTNGYKRVEFRHKQNGINKVEKQLVDRLVAETYLPKVRGKNEVDHRDRKRANNHYLNLKWANRTEQVKNSAAYKHGKYCKSRKKFPQNRVISQSTITSTAY